MFCRLLLFVILFLLFSFFSFSCSFFPLEPPFFQLETKRTSRTRTFGARPQSPARIIHHATAIMNSRPPQTLPLWTLLCLSLSLSQSQSLCLWPQTASGASKSVSLNLCGHNLSPNSSAHHSYLSRASALLISRIWAHFFLVILRPPHCSFGLIHPDYSSSFGPPQSCKFASFGKEPQKETSSSQRQSLGPKCEEKNRMRRETQAQNNGQ